MEAGLPPFRGGGLPAREGDPSCGRIPQIALWAICGSFLSKMPPGHAGVPRLRLELWGW